MRRDDTADFLLRLFALVALALFALTFASCERPTAPRPPNLHRGSRCFVKFLVYLDSLDHSAHAPRFIFTNTSERANCPDSVWEEWEDEGGHP